MIRVEYLTETEAAEVISWLGFHVRDARLLSSARPRASFAGKEVYLALHENVTALLDLLSRNHTLFDGNKRTAWMPTLLFLSRNGAQHTMADDEAFEYVLGRYRRPVQLGALN